MEPPIETEELFVIRISSVQIAAALEAAGYKVPEGVPRMYNSVGVPESVDLSWSRKSTIKQTNG